MAPTPLHRPQLRPWVGSRRPLAHTLPWQPFSPHLDSYCSGFFFYFSQKIKKLTKKHSLDNHIFPRARKGFQRVRMKWKRKGEESLVSTSFQMILTPTICLALKPGDMLPHAKVAYPGFPLTSRGKDQSLKVGSGGSCLSMVWRTLSLSIFLLSATYCDFQIFPFFLFFPLQSSLVWILLFTILSFDLYMSSIFLDLPLPHQLSQAKPYWAYYPHTSWLQIRQNFFSKTKEASARIT